MIVFHYSQKTILTIVWNQSNGFLWFYLFVFLFFSCSLLSPHFGQIWHVMRAIGTVDRFVVTRIFSRFTCRLWTPLNAFVSGTWKGVTDDESSWCNPLLKCSKWFQYSAALFVLPLGWPRGMRFSLWTKSFLAGELVQFSRGISNFFHQHFPKVYRP